MACELNNHRRRYQGDGVSFLRPVSGGMLLLTFTLIADIFGLSGFFFLALIPFLTLKFVFIPAGLNKRWSLSVLLLIALIATIVTGFSWSSVTLLAWMTSTFVVVYMFPGIIKRDDDLAFLFALLFIVSFAGFAVLHGLIVQKSPVNEAASFIHANMETIEQALDQAAKEATPEQAEALKKQWETLNPRIPFYLFGSIFAFHMTIVFATFRRTFFKWVHGNVPPLLNFRSKEKYVFILIFALCGEIMARLLHIDDIFYISRFLLIFMGIIYFIIGLVIVVALFQRQSKSFVSFLIPAVMMLLIVIRPLAATVIGVADIWIDFRNLRTTKRREASEK